ncbi:MAG: hypothetical protein QW039_00370 [Fervidicoccaceae archaeon]
MESLNFILLILISLSIGFSVGILIKRRGIEAEKLKKPAMRMLEATVLLLVFFVGLQSSSGLERSEAVLSIFLSILLGISSALVSAIFWELTLNRRR